MFPKDSLVISPALDLRFIPNVWTFVDPLSESLMILSFFNGESKLFSPRSGLASGDLVLQSTPSKFMKLGDCLPVLLGLFCVRPGFASKFFSVFCYDGLGLLIKFEIFFAFYTP